jgi:hypothetical protein
MRKAISGTWVLLVVVASASVSAVGAQHVAPGLAVGIAVPTGGLGRERSPGPVVQTYAVIGKRDEIARFQIGAEGVWFRGRSPAPVASSAYGNLRAIGILGNVVIAPPVSEIKPYLTLGGGVQWLSIEGRTNPYGRLLGLRSGLGIEAPWGNASARAEISAHVVLSDFGTGVDFHPGTYFPVTFAIQF